MKSATTGTVSGCIVWFIVFGALSLCIFPVVMGVGGISATSDMAIRTVAPIVCPDNTTPEIRSFATYGSGPDRTYVLECVDPSGEVVKEDPVAYAFIWMGILAVVGLVLAAILAFLFAAPAGVLIAKFLNRNKSNNNIVNIEPK